MFVFVLLCITFCPFYFCNHFEEKDGCFAFIVLQMYCYYTCAVALPHDAVAWFVVCDSVLPDHTLENYFVYGTMSHIKKQNIHTLGATTHIV